MTTLQSQVIRSKSPRIQHLREEFPYTPGTKTGRYSDAAARGLSAASRTLLEGARLENEALANVGKGLGDLGKVAEKFYVGLSRAQAIEYLTDRQATAQGLLYSPNEDNPGLLRRLGQNGFNGHEIYAKHMEDYDRERGKNITPLARHMAEARIQEFDTRVATQLQNHQYTQYTNWQNQVKEAAKQQQHDRVLSGDMTDVTEGLGSLVNINTEQMRSAGYAEEYISEQNKRLISGTLRQRVEVLGNSGDMANAHKTAAYGFGEGKDTIKTHPNLPEGVEVLIEEEAKENGYDDRFVEFAKGVAWIESRGDSNAVSRAGAKGIFQLRDITSREMGVTNPFDPTQNVAGGMGYLKKMLDMAGGDERLATVFYNYGPGNAKDWLAKGGAPSKLPTETIKYLDRLFDPVPAKESLFTPEDAAAVKKFLSRLNEQVRSERAYDFRQAIRQDMASFEDFKDVDHDYTERDFNAAYSNPLRAREEYEKYQGARAYARAGIMAREMTGEQLAGYREALENTGRNLQAGDENYTLASSVIGQQLEAVKRVEKTRTEDPAKATFYDDKVQASRQEWLDDPYNPEKYEAMRRNIRAKQETLGLTSPNFETPVVSKDDAAIICQRFNGPNFVDNLVSAYQAYGPQDFAAITRMGGLGSSAIIASQMLINGKDQLAVQAFWDAQQPEKAAQNAKMVKDMGLTSENFTREFTSQGGKMFDVIGGDAYRRNLIKENDTAILNYANYLATRGNSVEESIETALKDVFYDNYDIIGSGQRSYLAPKGKGDSIVSKNNMNFAIMDIAMRDDLNIQTTPYNAEADEWSKRMDLARNLQPLLTPDGQNYIFFDGNNPVTNREGKIIVKSVDDIGNYNGKWMEISSRRKEMKTRLDKATREKKNIQNEKQAKAALRETIEQIAVDSDNKEMFDIMVNASLSDFTRSGPYRLDTVSKQHMPKKEIDAIWANRDEIRTKIKSGKKIKAKERELEAAQKLNELFNIYSIPPGPQYFDARFFR